ncbi:hypothetical protein G5B38_01450 [Pseudohalocynthiibacter aestuariivivens]|nr:hypothetical protein [Pseudohalocynthiibacter aestuariivivens]QIE44305.1 hypothetical protein G5B38_01450 [Pseudohalocynthiibacter aestuariivivens]
MSELSDDLFITDRHFRLHPPDCLEIVICRPRVGGSPHPTVVTQARQLTNDVSLSLHDQPRKAGGNLTF